MVRPLTWIVGPQRMILSCRRSLFSAGSPPRSLVRYAGVVLGSASKLRSRIAPKRDAEAGSPPCVVDIADVPRRGPYRPWAALLQRRRARPLEARRTGRVASVPPASSGIAARNAPVSRLPSRTRVSVMPRASSRTGPRAGDTTSPLSLRHVSPGRRLLPRPVTRARAPRRTSRIASPSTGRVHERGRARGALGARPRPLAWRACARSRTRYDPSRTRPLGAACSVLGT